MKSKTTLYAPILLCVVFLLAGLSGTLVGAVQSVSANAFLSVSIIQFLVFLLPIAFYCGIRRFPFFTTACFRPVRFRDFPFLIAVSFCFLFGAAALKFMGFAFFGGAMTHTGSVISASMYTSNAPLVVLCFVLFPAVLEEILFRGVLFTEYRAYGSLFAVSFTALTFSMAHFSFENLLFYLFAGLIFGVMTQVSGSVLPAITLHAVYNALNLYMEEGFLNYLKQVNLSIVLLFFACGLFLLFLFLSVSALEHVYARRARSAREGARKALQEAMEKSRARLQKGDKPLTFGMRFREVYLSPTFILLVVLFLLYATGMI